MRFEVGLKLKKTMREIDEMPCGEFAHWLALFDIKADERKAAERKAKKGR